MGLTEEITSFESIRDYANPDSSFSLPRAALYLLGLTPELTGASSLGEALENIGSGLEITLLCAVPKGSGLGTSSILAAVILAALRKFFDIPLDYNELFRQVLQVEQMLTTGGGWQDQIGGVSGGVKYIESKPGLKPSPLVYQLDPSLFTARETAGCFTLYYTGFTRLAKNILQEVVDSFNDMRPSYLFSVHRIAALASRARKAIALRDLPALAAVIHASWEENKLIHPSTTNEDVEALLREVSGLYSGMKLLGAGGGGYALFISETPRQAEELRERLDKITNRRARLVDMDLNHHGLRVSVS
jgi:galactokinase/mevalonate kinase-like predicted kinase